MSGRCKYAQSKYWRQHMRGKTLATHFPPLLKYRLGDIFDGNEWNDLKSWLSLPATKVLAKK